MHKIGVGGFLIRLRGVRSKEDEMETTDGTNTVSDGDKPKRKTLRRKVKNKLTENFPAYLQVRINPIRYPSIKNYCA